MSRCFRLEDAIALWLDGTGKKVVFWAGSAARQQSVVYALLEAVPPEQVRLSTADAVLLRNRATAWVVYGADAPNLRGSIIDAWVDAGEEHDPLLPAEIEALFAECARPGADRCDGEGR